MSKETPQFVIGVDGGGSKTAAVVLNAHGDVLGQGLSGTANYHHHGLQKAGESLLAAMQSAAVEAGVDMRQATAVTWALAGVDRPIDRQRFGELAAHMLPGVPVQIENDARAALVGGLGTRQPGIVLIAGTGMIAYGENDAGDHARAGGWGHLIEQGSAYSLVKETFRAIANAHDHHIPTTLSQRLTAALQLATFDDMVTWIYTPQRPIAEIAALAPLVLAEAEGGDLVALGVVVQGAQALTNIILAVANRLQLIDKPFPLVLAGSLVGKNDLYRRLVIQGVQTHFPLVSPLLPRRDAAVGAALIALHAWQGKADEPYPLPQAAAALWMSEQRHVLSLRLDELATPQIVGLMHLQDQEAVASVYPILPALAQAADEVAQRWQQGGRLIYVGAGTSGRLGVLDAAECPPTFHTDPGQVVAVIAGGITAVEDAEDDPQAGAKAMQELAVGPLDSVVGIAASGRTPYVLGALQEAQQRQALTVALVCNLPAPLTAAVNHVLAPLVGPEILTGSTRLKAGTAQKLVLNMLSTAIMVRLGKTYSNLMVDVQATNSKLRARAGRIVAATCQISEEEATAVLTHCAGDVKTAIVSYQGSISPADAQDYLVQAKGSVRQALLLISNR